MCKRFCRVTLCKQASQKYIEQSNHILAEQMYHNSVKGHTHTEC